MAYKRKRRKKTLLGFSISVFIIGFVIMIALPISPVRSGKDAIDAAKGQDIRLEDNKHDSLVDSNQTFDFDGTSLLKKNADADVNELVKKYYEAMMLFDMDTMESLVSDIDRVDQNMIRAKLQYMENIDNIIVYTIAGDVQGTYRAYVYYDLKIRGIDTLAPALSAMYITMSSSGNYVVYLGELDGDTQEFIELADESQDVKLLTSLVSDRFNNVLIKDANMQNFYNMMNSAVSSGE